MTLYAEAFAPDGSLNATDRHLTTDTTAFREALKAIDLSGLTVLELGCGEGHLLEAIKAMPEEKQPDTIYAFEIEHHAIADEIKEWAADGSRKPRLIINPPEFKINDKLPDGDFTNYDFPSLLDKSEQFAIVSNPPYFLWNNVLSLTGEYLVDEDKEKFAPLKDKFVGALAVTSGRRLPNHPGWIVRAQLAEDDFTPRASTPDHYVIQTGFALNERYFPELSHIPEKNRPAGFTGKLIGVPERYVGIANFDKERDDTPPTNEWVRRYAIPSEDKAVATR